MCRHCPVRATPQRLFSRVHPCDLSLCHRSWLCLAHPGLRTADLCGAARQVQLWTELSQRRVAASPTSPWIWAAPFSPGALWRFSWTSFPRRVEKVRSEMLAANEHDAALHSCGKKATDFTYSARLVFPFLDLTHRNDGRGDFRPVRNSRLDQKGAYRPPKDWGPARRQEKCMAVELGRCRNPCCGRHFEYERFCKAFYRWGESGLLACPYCGAESKCDPDHAYIARPLRDETQARLAGKCTK